MPVFLPSGQLSGSPRRTQVLVIRDFATTCTCTCQHYCAIFMQSACVHVHMYMYTCTYTCTCTCTCTRMHYAAIHVTCVLVGMRPSGISQDAAVAANRIQEVLIKWFIIDVYHRSLNCLSQMLCHYYCPKIHICINENLH